MSERRRIYLPDIVGCGYKRLFEFQGKYVVIKGSRASKKSKTSAIYIVYMLMKYPLANALVVRKVSATLRDSCAADIKWACDRLGVSGLWKFTLNPLEATFLPTGQKILFRGLDDEQKLHSITVSNGVLNYLWIEEAYEIAKEDDFNGLDESIRGKMPGPEYKKRILITFNPWNDRHWLKKRFFDTPDDDNKIAFTTNYLCNEWLDDSDRRLFDEMKERNPRRWRTAAMGEWGITEGLIYENWEEHYFDIDDVRRHPGAQFACGLDFGYSVDPSAMVCAIVNKENGTIHVYDEMYKKGLTNMQIADEIKSMGLLKERIIADSAEPKSIRELYDLGIYRITAATKGPDSIRNGIQLLQNFKIIIHPKCVNFLREIGNYCWEKDRFGNYTGRPVDDENHLMDALRYCTSTALRGSVFDL